MGLYRVSESVSMDKEDDSEVIPKYQGYILVFFQASIALITACYCQLTTAHTAKEIFIFGAISVSVNIVFTYAAMLFLVRDIPAKFGDYMAVLIYHITIIPAFIAYYLLMSLIVYAALNTARLESMKEILILALFLIALAFVIYLPLAWLIKRVFRKGRPS